MNDMLAEGLNLMMMGMGAVFVFLTALVFTTTFMSRLVGRYAPAATPAPNPTPVESPAPTGDDPQLLAVISAAIHQHRSRQK